jgi:hypothetical protein
VWFSSTTRENVEIDSWFGSYYKITQVGRGGWVVRSGIALGYRRRDCNLFDWWSWPGTKGADPGVAMLVVVGGEERVAERAGINE